jgi:hypothetical protein
MPFSGGKDRVHPGLSMGLLRVVMHRCARQYQSGCGLIRRWRRIGNAFVQAHPPLDSGTSIAQQKTRTFRMAIFFSVGQTPLG